MVSKFLILCDHCLQEIGHGLDDFSYPRREYVKVHHFTVDQDTEEFDLHVDCLSYWAESKAPRPLADPRYGTPMIGLPDVL